MSNRVKSLLLSFLTLPLMLIPARAERRSRSGNVDTTSSPQLADYVNPFTGTDGASGWGIGCTVPGVALPFGMVQWGPDTAPIRAIRSDDMGTYVYRDGGIRGFSLNHLSGVGCPVMGDVPIMPIVGTMTSSPAVHSASYAAEFSHAREQASPGFYVVSLDNGVKVQLTATTRAGIGRFTFPASPDSNFLFDVGRNSGSATYASIEIVDNQKVSGSVSSGGFCGGPNKYTVYFVAEFNRPFARFGTWKDSAVNHGQRSARGPAQAALWGSTPRSSS